MTRSRNHHQGKMNLMMAFRTCQPKHQFRCCLFTIHNNKWLCNSFFCAEKEKFWDCVVQKKFFCRTYATLKPFHLYAIVRIWVDPSLSNLCVRTMCMTSPHPPIKKIKLLDPKFECFKWKFVRIVLNHFWQLITLCEQILAWIKFGDFGDFGPKSPNKIHAKFDFFLSSPN